IRTLERVSLGILFVSVDFGKKTEVGRGMEQRFDSCIMAARKRNAIDYKKMNAVGWTKSLGEDFTGGASESAAGDEEGSESDGEVAVMLDALEQLEREERRLRRQSEKEELRQRLNEKKKTVKELRKGKIICLRRQLRICRMNLIISITTNVELKESGRKKNEEKSKTDSGGSSSSDSSSSSDGFISASKGSVKTGSRKHRNSKKSGIKAKSADKVMHTQKYPHSQLRYEFVTQNIEFKNLTFNLFVAVCDLLKFGFPIGFEGDENKMSKTKESWKYKNYKGAEEFPIQVNDYLRKELECKAIISPFNGNHFSSNLLILPLNSVPKQTIYDRRVILDLSSVTGCAVNDFVLKDCYLGDEISLVFPKVDDFVRLVMMKGKGALMYKKDLSRAYRQIRVEKPTEAFYAYNTLGVLLEKCGLEESQKKSCPPSEEMTFLSVLFNSKDLTITITVERLKDIKLLFKCWIVKDYASRREVQVLLGKLNFIGACGFSVYIR
ncbi:hypothetical protein MAR_022003, partial [Mya arenaria]